MTDRTARNVNIEALRLAAIVTIAVFHTFQPLFSQATAYALADPVALGQAASAGDVAARMAASPAALGLLGFINLFGAFGNCVFFMISGYFLIPSAATSSHDLGFWERQAHRTLKRVAVILASVGLYAVLALLISSLVTPLPGISIHESGWLLGGLEFIWVYLAIMVCSPLIGWIWGRCPHRKPVVWAIALSIYAVNAYIAFVSPGDGLRGLLEWRKLMSAASYLAAFLFGGLLAQARPAAGRMHRARLIAVVAASLVLELALAALDEPRLLVATSFKSTSAISFALAALSLLTAASPDLARPSRGGKVIARAAASILGFYILQSMFYTCWRNAVDTLLALAASSLVAEFFIGAVAGIMVVAVFLAADRLLRMPLLRALGLA